MGDAPQKLRPLSYDNLQVRKTLQPLHKPPPENLGFGKTISDHMLRCTWRADTGWLPPEIVPSGPIALHPFCHVFHYALACYEGMKAFKDKDGKVRLFRPELNMKRFNVSAARLCLPQFDEAQLLECIKELLRMDADWVPGQDGYSMYMRPFMFSTTPWLGLTQCTEAMIYVLLSPVGPYFKSGFKPIKLYVDEEYTRAWPGGTGHVKAAGNYGPTVAPQIQAARAGCSQALFVHDKEKLWITEAGTMNVFFFIINDSDEKELVTPSLDDETTLPGITRLSVVELCRAWGEFKVTERHIGVPEVAERIRAGKVLEAFGTGTAAALQPISSFKWRGEQYDLDLEKSGESSGPLTIRITKALQDIQYGRVEHSWSTIV